MKSKGDGANEHTNVDSSSHLFFRAFHPCPLSDIRLQPPPFLLSPSFCCLSNLSPRLSSHAFSPPPPPPRTFSHLPLPPHLLSLSSPLLFTHPPLLSTPTHSWYSTDLSGQLYDRSAEKRGALLTLKATLYGQQCMQYTAAVRLCVNFTELAREKR